MATKGKKHLAGREEPAEKFSDRVVKEAKEQGVEVDSVSMSEQQRLLDIETEDMPTSSVQGDKMLCKFIRPHFEMDDDDGRVVHLEFSMALSDAHKKLVDDEVLDAWKYIDKHHPKGIIGLDIPAQTINLYLAPDDDPELHITAGEISGAKISVVEKTGDGKTEKITRLVFRVACDLSKNVTTFATTQFGNPIWIRMQTAQGVLTAD